MLKEAVLFTHLASMIVHSVDHDVQHLDDFHPDNLVETSFSIPVAAVSGIPPFARPDNFWRT
jgi:hypothetical protein